jgi:hypothetical protein
LKGKSVVPVNLGVEVQFTARGIKEYLNQPHKQYFIKNELIKSIRNILKNAEYKGITAHNKRLSHIFEIEILNEKSWLIANEGDDGVIRFYGITDSNKVLEDIKK